MVEMRERERSREVEFLCYLRCCWRLFRNRVGGDLRAHLLPYSDDRVFGS